MGATTIIDFIRAKKFFAFKDIKAYNLMVVCTLQSREYGRNGTKYKQYRVNIPQKVIEELLEWTGNDKLECVIIKSKKGTSAKLVWENITKSQ
ncbi:MAG: hypothetical protein HRU07_05845 [Nitrosopumilus sp.]|nr:hypothetical protein [Nitrosopumilus sp.]NRA05668.1 hypothetical protein [Nitrosopumilus sp.]